MENRRTTVVLEPELYRHAKRVALEQDKSLKEIIEEALRLFLRGGGREGRKGARTRFGVYPAKARTGLRRETIYRDFLK